YLEGQTYDQAARLLALAKGTVSTRLTHARQLLRRHLRRRGVVLSLAVLMVLLEKNTAPAAVPPHLSARAMDAAHLSSGGAISPRAAELVESVLPGLARSKLGTIAALVLALLVAGIAVWLWNWLKPHGDQNPNIAPEQQWEAEFTLPPVHPMIAH